MSLVRWLATCRSLTSVADGPSPYKMTQQNLVPRFGPKRSKAARLRAGIWCWFQEWVVEPWRPVARKLALWRPPWRWARKKRAKTAVQAELLLESVRVMRNDLREEDLAMVKKSRRQSIFAGPGQGTGRAWGRLTSRVFGPGQR